MLILTRKPGESLYIGDDIKITIVELKGHQIRVGIDAPKDLRIYREEIYLQILEENKKAAEAPMGVEVGLESLSAAWTGKAPESGAAANTGSNDDGDDESTKRRAPTLGTLVSAKRPEKDKDPTVVVKRKKAKREDD